MRTPPQPGGHWRGLCLLWVNDSIEKWKLIVYGWRDMDHPPKNQAVVALAQLLSKSALWMDVRSSGG